jgi:hypothetical protein
LKAWYWPLAALALVAISGCDRTAKSTFAADPGAGRVLVIAPHIQGEAYCPKAANDPRIIDEDVAAAVCARAHQNAAGRVAALLDAVGPARSPSGHYELGYTLTLPLMRYVRPAGRNWTIDTAELANDISLVRDVDRPVVVYLSLNHFQDSGEAAVKKLAANPRDLMWTAGGPLRLGQYFELPVNAWTLADRGAPIGQLRVQLVAAAAAEICRLQPAARARITAIDLLGEVHQLYPAFPDPPGYNRAFVPTDYSPASVTGFHGWLKERFGTVGALNGAVGGSFANFEAVRPPASPDPASAGRLAVFGWAYDPAGPAPRIALYVDGVRRAEAVADLNRTDVPEASPEVKTPNVGWRIAFDYRGLAPGAHTLELRATARGKVVRFGGRRFVVLARDGRALGPQDVPLAAGSPDSAGLRLVIDGPAPDERVRFDPMAELWLAYRNAQVAETYQAAADTAAKCLSRGLLFSHQITPELNGSWNPELLAVAGSEAANVHYLPGVTLYNGAAFGDAFFRFHAKQGWGAYGVSELNPTFPLSVGQMEGMLDRHRRAGARYVLPYYMFAVPTRIHIGDNKLTAWRITPDNPDRRYGAANFYRAIQELMRRG